MYIYIYYGEGIFLALCTCIPTNISRPGENLVAFLSVLLYI